MLINVGFFVEMVGDGISVFGISEEATSTLRRNIPFPYLCLIEVPFITVFPFSRIDDIYPICSSF